MSRRLSPNLMLVSIAAVALLGGGVIVGIDRLTFHRWLFEGGIIFAVSLFLSGLVLRWRAGRETDR